MNTAIPTELNPEIVDGTLLPCNCAFDVDGRWIAICNSHQTALTQYLRLARQTFKFQVLGDSNKMRDR